jgi:hypothetical protein
MPDVGAVAGGRLPPELCVSAGGAGFDGAGFDGAGLDGTTGTGVTTAGGAAGVTLVGAGATATVVGRFAALWRAGLAARRVAAWRRAVAARCFDRAPAPVDRGLAAWTAVAELCFVLELNTTAAAPPPTSRASRAATSTKRWGRRRVRVGAADGESAATKAVVAADEPASPSAPAIGVQLVDESSVTAGAAFAAAITAAASLVVATSESVGGGSVAPSVAMNARSPRSMRSSKARHGRALRS